jgi:hypothetical protein
MENDTLFKIIGITLMVIMTVIVILTFIELKQHPCGAYTCRDLFNIIENKSCWGYMIPDYVPHT